MNISSLSRSKTVISDKITIKKDHFLREKKAVKTILAVKKRKSRSSFYLKKNTGQNWSFHVSWDKISSGFLLPFHYHNNWVHFLINPPLNDLLVVITSNKEPFWYCRYQIMNGSFGYHFFKLFIQNYVFMSFAIYISLFYNNNCFHDQSKFWFLSIFLGTN